MRVFRLTPLIIAGGIVAACSSRRPPAEDIARRDAATPMQEADLSGTWDLVPGPPAAPSPARSPGMRLTLRVDSVRSGRPYGALAHLFSGDVGIDPAGFEPIEGAVTGDTVTFVVPRRGAPGAGITIVAAGSGDTLAVAQLVIASDTTRVSGGRMRLVRRR